MQYLQSKIGSLTEITDRAAQMGDNVVVSLLIAKRKAPKPSHVLNFGALFW